MQDREVLAEFTQKLQEQTDIPAWVLGSSSTVLAILAGKEETYGPRGKCFYMVFNALGVTFAAQLALQLIGSIIVTAWWLKARRSHQSLVSVEALFIGFGAGPEKQMVEKFSKEADCRIAHLDQTKPDSLATVALPGILQLWRESAFEARTIVQGLRLSKNSLIQDNSRQWLISAAIRFSSYIFIRVWAEALPDNIKRIVFIAADVPAFAVLDAKNSIRHRIEFWQHGLHRISIIFPPFKLINSINYQEALHMKRRLPDAQIELTPDSQVDQILNYTKTVLFVSPYESWPFSKHDYKHIIESIASWTFSQEIRLLVRPHPSEGAHFWQSQFPEILIDASTNGFNGAIHQLKPLFVVGWWSTSLLDALKAGILPVLIMDGSKSALADMVFPLAEIALNWPRDLELIEMLTVDRDYYARELMARQHAAFGVSS